MTAFFIQQVLHKEVPASFSLRIIADTDVCGHLSCPQMLCKQPQSFLSDFSARFAFCNTFQFSVLCLSALGYTAYLSYVFSSSMDISQSQRKLHTFRIRHPQIRSS